MGQTRRAYPVVEIAVATHGYPEGAGGAERRQEGDLVEVRPPTAGIGWLEMSRFLWLRVEGLEDADLGSLLSGITEGEVRCDKRRYRIPLERLAQVVPGFDVARARDQGDVYQPFLITDEETGRFVAWGATVPAEGLIYDTATGRYV